MELTSYIAEDLRARIASGGELPCKLTLPALAKHYGVSLTPVRGAIARRWGRAREALVRHIRAQKPIQLRILSTGGPGSSPAGAGK